MKVLHVISELYPLIKTGGLADVGYALPHALQQLGADVRILLPAYGDVLESLEQFKIVGRCTVQGAGKLHRIRILQATPAGFSMPLWLADCPELFDRPGNPYTDAGGFDWPDNAERFSCFSQAAAQIALGTSTVEWQPDVVHAHDWQTGMVPAFISQHVYRPKTVFTIHNLAYGGHFSHDTFMQLHLPMQLWHPEGVEFHGGFSMLKAGLVYTDVITTVSPTYAREILTPAFGYGMEGVLLHYRHKLIGILNGMDNDTWNPQTDPLLAKTYSIRQRRSGKKANKLALFEEMGCEKAKINVGLPLFGSIGRLVEQKGIDLMVEALPALLKKHDVCIVIVGDGQPSYQQQLEQLQRQHPDRIILHIGYSERLAHLVEASSDFFMMPSRFEPCGLNQLYSLRYGAIPIVHHVGGLADTVVDATPENILNKTATGLVFSQATSNALLKTLERAIALYDHPQHWSQIQVSAMQQDYSWQHSAAEYLTLYKAP